MFDQDWLWLSRNCSTTDWRDDDQRFGIDLPAYNGDDSFKLPVPATYIVRQDGVVVHGFVNADYTQRMEPAEIVARLESLAAAAWATNAQSAI